MSFKKRLLNVARAELKDAARKVKRSAEELIGGTNDRASADHGLGFEPAEEANDASANEKTRGGSGAVNAQKQGAEPAHIRRYYANLELPIGASAEEVKAAYRRLMRRYHPDLHQADKAKVEAATKLTQELRAAYEGLLEYLERR
jgi:DnaJ-domain-containing protein 1